MAAGSGIGAFLPLAMLAVGLVSILRARRARRNPKPDAEADRRIAAAAEMERRMANYLAGRDSGGR
jgi:hypothetical protein